MLKINNLHKTYKSKKGDSHHALRGINLEIGTKGFIVLLGKSGSGKSTLLNILGGLDKFDSGEIIIKDKSTKDFKANEWDSYRNTYVGFVFQEFYIIEEFTVGKNIALSLELQGYPKEYVDKRVDEILTDVDLEGYKDRRPSEISGGQKQRIAIARALVKDPQIILADEPTGNLDSETGTLILKTLKTLSKEKLVIMVTHDEEFAHTYGDRIIELKDGEIINDSINTNHGLLTIYELEGPVSTVIRLPKGRPITQKIINRLNEMLLTNDKDIYLSLSDDQNYMTKIVPNLNEKQSKERDVSEVLSHLNTSDASQFELKKTSLPFKNAFVLALSSLFSRKIRLIFMTLLFVISLVFVGIATNFSFYDSYKASILTFKESGIDSIPLIRNKRECLDEDGDGEKEYCRRKDIPITLSDVEDLKTKYETIKFFTSYEDYYTFGDLFGKSPNKQSRYYVDRFKKITIVNDYNKEAVKLAYGGFSNHLNEVMITDFVGSLIIEYGIFEGITEIEQLVDQTFEYNYSSITIAGIVDTDYEKYQEVRDYTGNDIDIYYSSGFDYDEEVNLSQLYMTEDTYIDMFEKDKLNEYSLYINNSDYSERYTIISSAATRFNNQLVGHSRMPDNRNEILVSQYVLSQIFRGSDQYLDIDFNNVEDINTLIGNKVTIKGSLSKEYIIVGVIQDFSLKIIMHDDEFQQYYADKSSSNHERDIILTAVLSDREKDNIQFLKEIDKLHYKHETYYSGMLYGIQRTTTTSKIVLYIVGGVFALFSALMIFTFISSSINQKQKEIGTLRAIGARGIDVSKIFIIEFFIIAIFSSTLANIGVAIVVRLVNNSIVNSYQISLVLLYINIISILVILLLSLFVTIISAFIPVKRITLMSPIKAIKQ